MVLTPNDLLMSVYLCLNKLAPAYEGIELGIGESLLIKAIAQTTGRSVQQIKADVGVKGDLGIVAETSRGTQRTMFQVKSCLSIFTKKESEDLYANKICIFQKEYDSRYSLSLADLPSFTSIVKLQGQDLWF